MEALLPSSVCSRPISQSSSSHWGSAGWSQGQISFTGTVCTHAYTLILCLLVYGAMSVVDARHACTGRVIVVVCVYVFICNHKICFVLRLHIYIENKVFCGILWCFQGFCHVAFAKKCFVWKFWCHLPITSALLISWQSPMDRRDIDCFFQQKYCVGIVIAPITQLTCHWSY